ncbi:MMPL family transporter [Skermania piniformis]|uniref:MMPL family transporter n=1 Tax=Skermania pinensis TaxID=39122 RepID=A0ABX8SCE8_9ACTN|nr:MMPL family transporter [Skermania piniformis]QXQ15554.1 MMPL family transporter [Skermania piniformis]
MADRFAGLGRWICRARWTVLAAAIVLVGLSGLYGLDLGQRLSQEGWFDDSSESVRAAELADRTFGRDTDGDVLVLYTAPPGRSVDDPALTATARAGLARLATDHPDAVLKVDGYWDGPFNAAMADPSRQHAFASVGLTGSGSVTLTHYLAIEDDLRASGGELQVQLAGVQPVVQALNDGMQRDIHRAELIALPVVAVLLFFVFGGAVAALLPVLIGGMTIIATQGVMRYLTTFIEVNAFATAVVTLVSLGLAIDYGLFTVSRFREELAAGRSVDEAVIRTVATSGRTIVFSALIIATSLAALLIFPIRVLRSVAYGGISSVLLAALLSVTVLPAVLRIIGHRVDALSWRRFARTRTAAQIDAGWFSRLAVASMRRPWLVAVPIVLLLLALVAPARSATFGGLSERYLAPDNPARVAQQDFDAIFPAFRAEPLRLVVIGASNDQLAAIRAKASAAPGLTGPFEPATPTEDGTTVLQAGLVDKSNADLTIAVLRGLEPPAGVRTLVTGIPALERDAINGMIDGLPVLALLLVLTTTLIMLVAFGSLLLAVKAIVLSLLSLGATLGILTWIFVDGHGAAQLNVTPGPLMFAALLLIVVVVSGLSTDYEVFLMSRMVEARADGASTPEAIRSGVAHTGGVITAAASILVVVTGAFGFSDLAMMKYIAYGMIAALIIDATVIRMLLVPVTMRLMGDRTWGRRLRG